MSICSISDYDRSMNRYLLRIQLGMLTTPVWASGVGAFIKGNVLILGEQASDPSNAPEQQPFCSSKGCSGWLNNLLEEAKIPEDHLFWLNVNNNDGTKIDLHPYIHSLKPRAVIALGSVAATRCIDQQIEYEKFYHPQYWKRFHYNEPYVLIDRLRELLK